YSLAYSLTPLRRELDYLRTLGTSRESAKELKIFGLAPWLRERFSDITEICIGKSRRMAVRRLRWGTLFAVFGAIGYYGAYAWVVVQALHGGISIGDVQFLINAIATTSQQVQAIFLTFAGIADQALFLTDLIDFFAMQPRIGSNPGAIPAPRPIREGFEFQN